MAESLVSGVLGQLASITTDLTMKELRLVKDVDESISSLRRKLKDIQAVLEDAERKQLDDARIRRWLDELTDISYDIDDVLDEWSSETLKSEIQKRVEAEENGHQQKAADKKKKKVCTPLTSSCFSVNQLKRVGVRRDIAHRIKRLNETLEEIAKDKQHYSLETTKVVQKQTRETISFVDESQVYGLDGPKNALIEKLLNESSEGLSGGGFRIDFDQTIIGCKMHDILNDFAQFLTRKECSSMRVEVDMEKTEPPSVEKIRHSWLALAPNFPKIPTSIFDQSNLRSLFIQCTSDTSLGGENMVLFHQNFRYLKHLRTLALISSKITKVPEQIGQLIHLRYLNLFQSRNLQELADEVCDLCNLQSLRIEGCSRLQRLPEGMGKLVNLRHLYMRGCKELVGLPKGIGGLTQLRTLDTMFIPKKNEAAYFLSLGDLKSLNHLRFQRYIFEITKCCNLINRSESELTYWECLVYLILNFGEADKKEEIRDEEDEFGILEALQPHPSLRGLLITEYKGTSLYPKWMMGLDKLTGLHITHCKQCESLPPLGSLLPSLKELRIDGLDKVKKIGDEFLGLGVEQAEAVSFPKLERLGFHNMRDWEDWEGTAHTSLQSGVMPCLQVLVIENCGNLKSLPPFLKLTPLHTLCIDACGVLLQSLQEFTKFSHIPCIIIDGQEVQFYNPLLSLSLSLYIYIYICFI
ncbi:hypothetical protein FEM48_Zijuj03G0002500 [Ziziphus jujuba var. spinosa]|uniref:Rx N-terminal domain-containing protein n=1 Tax=Ziziphus jujuba var. spinosa TaxID=714518 RepID=A0A978VM30_ZIZJJ|nr:hypothetical protein FEM48_Zijuj03G0002500 [Ziziphus jujuba var. spinosa]